MALTTAFVAVNSPTRILRILAILGAYAGGVWLLGFFWEAFLGKDATTPVLLFLPAVVVAVVAVFVFRLLPGALSVESDIGWRDLAGRLVVGALVTYPILALLTGLVAAGLIRRRGFSLEGEAVMAVWLLALWLPLWFLPLSASVVAWLLSRNAEAI